VGRGLAALEFELEVLGAVDDGIRVRHPDDGRHAAGGGRSRRGLPVFLVLEAGFAVVDVAVDNPGNQHVPLGVEDAISLRKTVASADGDDSSVLDGDARVGRPARRRDDGTVTHDEIHGHCRGVAEDRAYSFPKWLEFRCTYDTE